MALRSPNVGGADRDGACRQPRARAVSVALLPRARRAGARAHDRRCASVLGGAVGLPGDGGAVALLVVEPSGVRGTHGALSRGRRIRAGAHRTGKRHRLEGYARPHGIGIWRPRIRALVWGRTAWV